VVFCLNKIVCYLTNIKGTTLSLLALEQMHHLSECCFFILSEKVFLGHSNLFIQHKLTEVRYDVDHPVIHNIPFSMLI
jgi:hypothetical protein